MRYRVLAPIGAFLMLLAVAVAPAARAAPVLYNFTFSETQAVSEGGSGSFSGQFAVEAGLITAVTGTSTLWGTITGILAVGVLGGDNAFSPSSPWLTGDGVSFETASRRVNLYSTPTAWIALAVSPTTDPAASSVGTLSVTLAETAPPADIPEPASLALLAAGLLGFTAVRSRGRAAPLPA